MTEQQYKTKREEILSKFNSEFIEKYYLRNANFHAVIQMLSLDTDPYIIIESLIEGNIKLMDKMQALVKYIPPPPIKVDKI